MAPRKSEKRPKGKPPRKFKAHYISGTHWDREWYRPFQEYRIMLVEIMDDILDLMEGSQDFRYFHLDGQSCIMRDYVEIRPENHGRLEALIRNGRILVGPWFTLPDFYCPGDEALVRNLLVGRRVCRQWGVEPMPVAYACDMFGHPSQMPQIYAGFRMPYCVLGRGTNEHTTPPYFNWLAPDGSKVFCFKLQDYMGYGAFATSRKYLEPIFIPGSVEDDSLKPAKDEEEGKAPFDLAREDLRRYVTHEMERSNVPVLCLIDALDHMPPAHDAKGYLRMLREACPQVEAEHSNLVRFFEEARAEAADVPSRTGELFEVSKNRNEYLWLLPNCVSARVRLKQVNDACQVLLERWVEPLVALARAEGHDVPKTFLDVAWEYLLLNHAHDSICGTSIDQVHRDMMNRYDQVRTLGEQLRNRTLGFLTRSCKDLATRPGEFTLTIANPLPLRGREVVVFDVDLPLDFPGSFHEGWSIDTFIKAFTLTDGRGKEVPYQRLAVVPRTRERTRYAWPALCTTGDFTRYTVAAEVDLPAAGFTSLLVKPSETPVRRMGTLRTAPWQAENEHLAIAIQPNGLLTITDKATGEAYRDLLALEDGGEMGNGWFYVAPQNDKVVLSSASPAQVSILHDGPELVTFLVEVAMEVPARYDPRQGSRSRDHVTLRAAHRITLRRSARTVDLETTVENTAEDHRLRLLLPTDIAEAKTYLAHHPYDLVVRPIALDPKTETWQEMEQAARPMLHLQAIGAGRRGLAFLSAGGLHQGGVVDDVRRTMLVTLLRSFRLTWGTMGEEDGLEKGTCVFRYALLPYAGTLDRAQAFAILARLQTGLITRQTGPVSSAYPAMTGKDKPEKSFVEQKEGRLVCSALKPAEAGEAIILRLWNPTGEVQRETLEFWRPIRAAALVNLAEEPTGEPAPVAKGRTLRLEARPHGIVTVRVELA